LSGQTCVSTTVTASTPRWTLGSALSPESFLLAKLALMGTGRYSTTTYAATGVRFPAIAIDSPLRTGALLDRDITDSQAATDSNVCHLHRLEDGRYHCLVGAVATVIFLDPACTQPAAGQYVAYASYDVTQDGYQEVCAFDSPYKLFTAGALLASGQLVQTYQILPTTGLCSAASPLPVRELVGALDPSSVPSLALIQE
jgi:hypothetical protein